MSEIRNCPVCKSISISKVDFNSHQDLGDFEISECKNCSHRFLKNPPSFKELENYYHDLYAKDKRVHKTGKPRFRDYALNKTLKSYLPKNASVLDIGANFGSTLLAFPKSYNLEGIELSESAANAANKSSRLKIHQTSFEEINLPNSRFDCIVSLAVIEHIFDINFFLKKISKLLKPGGIVVLMTGDYSSWSAQNLSHNWHLYHSGGHLHFFSKKSLHYALNQHGLITYKSLWSGPNRFTFKLPSLIGRILHCQTTSLLFPMLFAKKHEGDHIYVWAKLNK